MTFDQFKAERARLIAAVCEAERAWKAIPGVGQGAIGLTPDSVKASPEYRQARRAFDSSMRALQSFNARHLKAFKRELAQEQRAKRESLAA